MPCNEIPLERLKELRTLAEELLSKAPQPEAVPAAGPASELLAATNGLTCDVLQSRMEAYYGSAISDPAEAGGYMGMFMIALLQGCSFIWDGGNPYHTDPTNGKPFQLEMAAYSWDVRGCKLRMNGDHLQSNDLNRKGDYDPGKDTHDLFSLVPSGHQEDGRTAYYIVVNTGSQAGKVLCWDGPGQAVVAREFKDRNDIWTLVNDDQGVLYNHKTHGDEYGEMVLDVPDGKGNRDMGCWGYNGGPNQRWLFRYPAYTG
ncbi:hypothetical protein [Streptomyces klenkii]|uniref:hypothetical protein n=1 Tax=Streptomyces klenkii TaxID=1420899 RepID=UPI0034364613